MHRKFFRFTLFILPILILVACQEQNSPMATEAFDTSIETDGFSDSFAKKASMNKIVTADRASGTISVIDASSNTLMETHKLPSDGQQGEPMYVVFDKRSQTVFVGDRANSRVVAYDSESFEVKALIPTGNGVFHMWADPRGQQLWVNNDIDKTITVIDPQMLNVITTFAMPADLMEMGGKPHDVILDPRGKYAYVSFLGFSGAHDYVVKYDTDIFIEKGRAAVGKDPHLSLTQKNHLLYVPCQGSDAVYVLDRHSMMVKEMLQVPGAHGAGMALNGRTFYTTNLPNGGNSGLWAIDVRTNSVLGNVDAPFAVPHNIALTPDGKKIFVTHSGGSSNKVSVYSVERRQQVPQYEGEVTVGYNPFGLAYVQ